MNKEILVYKKEDCVTDPNCYRVIYHDDNFVISFGNMDKGNNRVDIDVDLKLDVKKFKQYFISMLDAIDEYNMIEKKDFLQDVIDYMDKREA